MMEESTGRGLAVRAALVTGAVPLVAPVLSCILQFALVHFSSCSGVVLSEEASFTSKRLLSYDFLPQPIMRLDEIKGILCLRAGRGAG